MIYLGSVEFLNLLRYQVGCTYVCASKIPMHIYMCPPYIYVVIHFLLLVHVLPRFRLSPAYGRVGLKIIRSELPCCCVAALADDDSVFVDKFLDRIGRAREF